MDAERESKESVNTLLYDDDKANNSYELAGRINGWLVKF